MKVYIVGYFFLHFNNKRDRIALFSWLEGRVSIMHFFPTQPSNKLYFEYLFQSQVSKIFISMPFSTYWHFLYFTSFTFLKDFISKTLIVYILQNNIDYISMLFHMLYFIRTTKLTKYLRKIIKNILWSVKIFIF